MKLFYFDLIYRQNTLSLERLAYISKNIRYNVRYCSLLLHELMFVVRGAKAFMLMYIVENIAVTEM